MRKLVLACAVLTLTACHEGLPSGSVAVSVVTQGFVPGCLTITAEDPSNGKKSTAQATSSFDRPFALLGNGSWGPTLTVSAEAREQSCSGNVVATASQEITLPPDGVAHAGFTLAAQDLDGDGWVSEQQSPDPGSDCDDSAATVHPKVLETCGNGVDDDCDGKVDDGDSDFPDWYADRDGDGYGDPASKVTACAQPDPSYLKGVKGDCDDGNAQVHPGAVELCNGIDDDCVNGVDDGVALVDLYPDEDHDGFGKQDGGAPYCLESDGTFLGGDGGVVLVGTRVFDGTDCDDDPAGGAALNPGNAEVCGDGLNNDCMGEADDADAGWVSWYVDLDGDGHAGTEVTSCAQPAGGVRVADDCDDGDPYSYADAGQICDERDNRTCAFLQAPTNEPGCPTGADWANANPIGGNPNLNTASAYAPGALWIASDNHAVAVRTDPAASFTTIANPCGISKAIWHASWASDSGVALIGGQNRDDTPAAGAVIQIAADGTCTVRADLGTNADDVLGVFGTQLLADGGWDFFAVTSNGQVLHDGQLQSPVLVDGGVLPPGPSFSLHDLHGISPSEMVAVGNVDPGGGGALVPHAFFYDAVGGTWNERATMPSGGTRLLGTWMVNDQLAYAVGDGDFVAVWNGQTWASLPGPSAEAGHGLTSVLAFGPSDVYVTTDDDNIWRTDGTGWDELRSVSLPLRDLTGTSPEDLWAVGQGGVVTHWHQP